MSVITQPNDLADLLRFEAESRYSRERVTLAAGHNLTLGTVIATDTAEVLSAISRARPRAASSSTCVAPCPPTTSPGTTLGKRRSCVKQLSSTTGTPAV